MVRGTARSLEQIGSVDAGTGGPRGGGGGSVWGRAAMLLAWAALAMSTTWGAGAAPVHDPEAPLRIPLEPIGFQPLQSDFMLAGSPMLTVDFVDKDHLLITFGVRRLMKREMDPPADDNDRTIGAFLVELPSGKVLARTEWREHDRRQYLWNLGHGHFLLRVRDNLTVLSPMQGADGRDAFQEAQLLRFDRHMVAATVSPLDDLLTVQTVLRAAREGEATDENGGPLIPGDPAPVHLNFYRLESTGGAEDHLFAVSAGALGAPGVLGLPMTSAGFLDTLAGGKGTWMFNFDEHAGKVNELAQWYTSCFPRSIFVDPSEWVSFGCRGSDDKRMLAGFNLKGEQMWQQNFFESFVTPTFAFAPAAGRFALGRTMVTVDMDASSVLPSTAVTGQEVRVYQSYDGRQLFHIDCSPVERAGQNFALSEDGLRLAVIRQTMVHHAATQDYAAYTEQSTAVEVYPLPPLTEKDRAEVKEAQARAPADTGARIDVSLTRSSATSDKAAAADTTVNPGGTAGAVQTSAGAPAASDAGVGSVAADSAATVAGAGGGSAAGAANATAASAGDVEQAAPRKPPTLYGPDETPAEKSTDSGK